LKKPNWACPKCGMYSSRRYSVKRHIKNIHGGNCFVISFADYLIGRKDGIYLSGIPPMYIAREEDKTNKINYTNILNEELFRCTIRKCFEKSQISDLRSVSGSDLAHKF
jgi:hypothetical protein